MIHERTAPCRGGANRTRAIGIRDPRRSEMQLAVHRARAWAAKLRADRERVGEAARINSFTEAGYELQESANVTKS